MGEEKSESVLLFEIHTSIFVIVITIRVQQNVPDFAINDLRKISIFKKYQFLRSLISLSTFELKSSE